jgi:hypothetical protein
MRVRRCCTSAALEFYNIMLAANLGATIKSITLVDIPPEEYQQMAIVGIHIDVIRW